MCCTPLAAEGYDQWKQVENQATPPVGVCKMIQISIG